ncbi:MAG: DNA mismatch repair endonuclease MutL [Bacteroidota bacterium]
MQETLANKIAAGEVVQRPASVAKELIENSIDAGADNVDLILKGAGSALIQVVDDGCGMTAPDALICFKRHATSKIRSVDDLERIATFGFRGEALASIASVSQVELRTKQVGADTGTLVRLDGGVVVAQEPCATADGTSISVKNLFFNVPARRNFLKTPATEFKHLVETFQVLAMANPAVGFRLTHDEAEAYRLPRIREEDPIGALRRRLSALFGDEYAQRSYSVEEQTSYLSLRGLVGHSDFSRKSRGEQYLFVNGRYVKSRYLDHAVIGGYEGLLPDGSYPFFALFLTVDPRHIDVNVHPTKAEIKFDDERGVYAFVRSVIKRTLGKAHLVPDVGDEDDRASGSALRDVNMRPASFSPTGSRYAGGPASSGDGFPAVGSDRPPAASGHLDAGALSDRFYGPLPDQQSSPHDDASRAEAPEKDDRLLWQLHEKYILTQIRSGLMVLDQNAAHERILYERALQSMTNGLGLSQQLLFPHTIELSAADFELLKELLDDLRSLGFDIEVFSGRSVVIRGVPAEIRAGDERSMLRDIVEQYKAYRQTLQLKGKENLAKSIARRSAIRPGMRLSTAEMRALIDQLFDCEMPYACPMGRPTLIKIPIEELDKRFGR